MPLSEELKKQLVYSRKNFWKDASESERKAAFAFADRYMHFLTNCKTVRTTVRHYIDLLQNEGWKDMATGERAEKMYYHAHGKVLAAIRLGKKPVADGVNIVAAHIDTPHIDLKPAPLYEDGKSGLAMLTTHYYGGIKKYQWMSTPLALHGVIIRRDGKTVDVNIGEKEDDPVFVMPDILPHLAYKVQNDKKIQEAVSAAHLNVVFAGMPYTEEDAEIKEAVKLEALRLLHERYGVTEADLLAAELEIVPAGKARSAGLDSSFILAYGQDDRVCAYTAMQAVLDAQNLEHTVIALLVDKEEIGSEGNTGAAGIIVEDLLGDLLKVCGEPYDSYTLRKALIHSQILSADVNVALNPNFPTVLEKSNAVHLGCGVSLTKYTGSGGKGGCNDSHAEFNALVSRIFDDEGVFWQTGELGKTDEGGGGTIAKFLARLGSEVIDCGTGLLGMHSLYELSSKADVYSTYRAYKAFFEKA